MDMRVWQESGETLLREALRQEARKWHLLHQPPCTLTEWRSRSVALRQQLRRWAGTFPEPVPLDIREHGSLRLDGYRIAKITYQSRADLRVTANLYIPDGHGPFPGVLGVHGHWQQGKISARVAARGHTLAKEGFVVLMVDAFGAGERGTVPGRFEYHGAQIGASLFPIGETLLGMQIYDNMRGIDLLQSLDMVDGARIGATGASGGGNQTMWIAAFDDRVKAAVPVVSVGTFESYITRSNCVCEVFPNGLTFMEEWAVLALVAPNALLILNSLQDGPTFCVQEMIRSFNGARAVYRLFDAEDRIAYKAIDLPHGYWPEMRSHMLGWFKRWLKGEGSGWPGAIPEIPDLPEPELMCFPKGERPTEVRSILDYVALRGAAKRHALLDHGTALDAAAKRADLAEALRVPRATLPAVRGPVVRACHAGQQFEKFAVESEPGVLLPCAVLRPEADGAATTVIAVHPGGKDTLRQCDAVAELLEAGTSVCLADLRNMGETAWDHNPIHREHDAARSALWLGRTMLGDWVHDLRAIANVLRAEGGGGELHLLAFAELGLAAMAAAALTETFAAVTVYATPASFVAAKNAPTAALSAFVPGILDWGDVSLLAALAQSPLTVRGPVALDGTALDAEARLAWRDEALALAERLGRPARLHIVDDSAASDKPEP